MNKIIEIAAQKSELAELYDRYYNAAMKSGDDDVMDYDFVVNAFAQLIINECVNVCLSQRNPQNLNYKPSEKFADAIQLHFNLPREIK